MACGRYRTGKSYLLNKLFLNSKKADLGDFKNIAKSVNVEEDRIKPA